MVLAEQQPTPCNVPGGFAGFWACTCFHTAPAAALTGNISMQWVGLAALNVASFVQGCSSVEQSSVPERDAFPHPITRVTQDVQQPGTVLRSLWGHTQPHHSLLNCLHPRCSSTQPQAPGTTTALEVAPQHKVGAAGRPGSHYLSRQ